MSCVADPLHACREYKEIVPTFRLHPGNAQCFFVEVFYGIVIGKFSDNE